MTNGRVKVYNIDVDGTLTNGEPFWKDPSSVTVNEEMKSKVREMYEKGNIVIIHTARQWEKAPETIGWLIANRIPFHGIMMGKGACDQYIDDKTIRPEEIQNLSIPTFDYDK